MGITSGDKREVWDAANKGYGLENQQFSDPDAVTFLHFLQAEQIKAKALI